MGDAGHKGHQESIDHDATQNETEARRQGESAEGKPEQEETEPTLSPEMFKPSILVQWFVAAMVAKAWEAMGLVADPLSGKVEKNLSEARIAIDAVSALYPVMHEGMGSEEKRRFEALLTDLRINFVNQSREG